MADSNHPETTQDLNLDNIDAVVLLDQSGSMDTEYKDGKSRWKIGEESISALAEELAQHDDDGITVITFNDGHDLIDGVTPDKVDQIFKTRRPGGGTYLAAPLKAAINKFLPAKPGTRTEKYTVNETVKEKNPKAGQKKGGLGGWFGGVEPDYIDVVRPVEKTRTVATGGYEQISPKKQVFIAVYTDGEAGDEQATIDVIVDASKRIKGRRDLGILFIQVGNDSRATAFLERLNDGLKGIAAFDIVAVEKLEDLEDFSIEQLIKKAFTE